ncbi:hypothetical protein CABS01_04845 [Colletotrichum abscissum]|uniref:uncharacterized protein n=1 Tax=Colletotrichum abscissum TaxID=1671311 RepID=UPI0027D6E87E|nr:uncharacterized protein CABS01_04845 [Colletotrichum abscissum]KAK1472202.1 hypothetical protein CABS01_04845 [Colletotrichum abscissum]
MPVDKSAPLGLGALFGQLDAVAIVANVGTPKKWRSTFRRCGIRLGDSTNAVDSRAGTDVKIRHIDAGLEIMLYGARNPSDTGHIMDVREYIRGPLTLDEKEYVMRDLAAHAGWHQEVLCALEWVQLAL